ncbi:MAG TPA: hypothetical protein VNL17_11505 [Verrucomicrobiae bacterium]|nr:hypothetical protein [Verrucomicrobiae bacterium]
MDDYVLSLIIAGGEGIDANAERDTRGLPITLCVGGLLVSGVIISHNRYMELLADGAILKHIDSAMERLSASKESRPGSEEPRDDEVEFIHLASAKFWHPGSHQNCPGGNGVLWRGRVDAVDGFFLGELGLAPSGQ